MYKNYASLLIGHSIIDVVSNEFQPLLIVYVYINWFAHELPKWRQNIPPNSV